MMPLSVRLDSGVLKLNEHIFTRLDRLEASAKELSTATGRQCIALQADVRDTTQLQAAVAKTVEKYGRIDFVICGAHNLQVLPPAFIFSANPSELIVRAPRCRCRWELPRADLQPVRERVQDRPRD